MLQISMQRLAVLALAMFAGAAAAQAWPSGPVRIIACAPAGSTTDIIARVYQDALGAELGQPIVIDNRPGAGGLIGAEATARARPDGQTFGLCFVGPVAIQMHLQRMPYDPDRDLMPLTVMANTSFAMVSHPPLGRTLEEFRASATRPGADLSFGSIGAGSVANLAMQLLAERTGMRLESVIYSGTPAALTDMVAGRIAAMILHPSVALPFARDNRVNILFVTGTTRHPVIPDVPSVVELGLPELVVDGWNALFAPGGTPAEINARMVQAVHAAARRPAVIEALAREGYVPGVNTPEQLTAQIRADRARWGELIRTRNITN
jgi:tripartite-type tricarboxylate transporter receptor subunit TctC